MIHSGIMQPQKEWGTALQTDRKLCQKYINKCTERGYEAGITQGADKFL